MSLLDRINKISPKLCRAVARQRHGQPISHEDLGKLCGMTKWDVMRLVKKDRWDDVQIGVAVRFAEACGVDLLNPGKIRYRLRRMKSVIKNLAPVQRILYGKLLGGVR